MARIRCGIFEGSLHESALYVRQEKVSFNPEVLQCTTPTFHKPHACPARGMLPPARHPRRSARDKPDYYVLFGRGRLLMGRAVPATKLERFVFNLLVQGSSWGDGRDTVSVSRVFEYTDEEVAARFRDGGKILLDELMRLPCIFIQEGTGDELARVGTITRARVAGRDISIEYTYNLDIPPLLNSTIYANRLDFDMPHDFEFSRTHWAVKDVDLYRVLIRHTQPRRQRPSVFEIPEHERIEPSLVSAMMPFDAGFNAVYETLKETVERASLRIRRADDIWENPAIIQDIVSLIDRSRVVIADCTGRNPNVFYEIGIAHTLGRDVILITQNPDDIPFDLRHLRYVRYLNNREGRQALSAALDAKLTSITSS
jgi:hypothetical protein